MECSLDYFEHLYELHSPTGEEQYPITRWMIICTFQLPVHSYVLQSGHACLLSAVQCFLFQDPCNSRTACYDEKITSE